MGLVNPFICSGNDLSFIKNFIDMLEEYCPGCQTEDRFNKGCHGCPAGGLIYGLKEYILDCDGYRNSWSRNEAIDKDQKDLVKLYNRYDKTLNKLQIEVEKIEPHPFFNSNMITQNSPSKDILEKVKKYYKLLEWIDSQINHPMLGWGRGNKDVKVLTKSYRRAKLDLITGEKV